MKIEQISIFLENRVGRLVTVTRALKDANINIRAMSLADTSDFGILRLVVSEPDKAKVLLKDLGFTLGSTSVVAVEVTDQPGGLDNILSLISTQDISIEYMYAFVQKDPDKATLIFRFDKTDKALELLSNAGIHILTAKELYS